MEGDGAFRLPGAGEGSFPLCCGTFARSYSVLKSLVETTHASKKGSAKMLLRRALLMVFRRVLRRCLVIQSFEGKKSQDKFDHDKEQKSAISWSRLHWRLSTGYFLLLLQYLCAI